MAWLAKVDTRAARWPFPLRWLYRVCKWHLIAGLGWGLLFNWTQNLFAPPWLKAAGEAFLDISVMVNVVTGLGLLWWFEIQSPPRSDRALH